MNVDVNLAVATASKAESSLAALRGQVAKLSIIDMAEYDKITTYARALAWAQAIYSSASSPREGFLDNIERASKLREILLAEVKALIARGVTDRRPLDSLKGGSGYSSVGTDLSTLASVLRAHPDEVAAKTMKLVDEAQKLSAGIMRHAFARSGSCERVGGHGSEKSGGTGPRRSRRVTSPASSALATDRPHPQREFFADSASFVCSIHSTMDRRRGSLLGIAARGHAGRTRGDRSE